MADKDTHTETIFFKLISQKCFLIGNAMVYIRGLKHAARGPHVVRQMCLCGTRHL